MDGILAATRRRSRVHVIGNAIAKDYPFDEDAAKCEKIGELLASA